MLQRNVERLIPIGAIAGGLSVMAFLQGRCSEAFASLTCGPDASGPQT
jgi:hypothetical protein